MDIERAKVGIYIPHGDVPDERGFSPAIVAWQLGRRLCRFEPVFICARENRARPLREHSPVIARLEEGRLYRRLFRKWSHLDPWPLHCRAARTARRLHPAIWHAHQLEFPVNDFRAVYGSKVPIIIHAHVTSHSFSAKRGVADRYLAVSEYVRGRLIETGYPSESVEVLPNGVDTTLFRPANAEEKRALRIKLGLPLDTIIILFVGRKQIVKGFDLFLSVAATPTPALQDVFWLAVGPEPPDAAREAGYESRKRLRQQLLDKGQYQEWPTQGQEILAKIIRASDVLFVPSRIETQGMVMIEGLASGIAVISRAVGGILESIHPGVTGFLLRPEANLDETLDLLQTVVGGLADFEGLRQMARADAVARFAWASIAEKLEGIYQSVLSESRV